MRQSHTSNPSISYSRGFNPRFYTNVIQGRHEILAELVRVCCLSETLLIKESPLLLSDRVLDPFFLYVMLFEPADVHRIPEFRGDTEILAAAHQGVGFGTLNGSGDRFGAEVIVVSLRLGDHSAFLSQRMRLEIGPLTGRSR